MSAVRREVRWSRTAQKSYVATMARRRLGQKLHPLSTVVPQGVLDHLDRKAFKNGTTIAEEARKALIYATGEYVV